ncbi:MAG TPA: hypothetical protein V6C81_20070 [Planktothrix sp.]
MDAATSTVSQVESIKTHDGAQHAFHQLSSDYQNYKSTHTGAETTKYWNKVESQLKTDGVLPDLAVAWATENVGKPNEISAQKLDHLPNSSDALNKTMVSELKEKYQKLAHDNGVGSPENKEQINDADVHSRLKADQSENQMKGKEPIKGGEAAKAGEGYWHVAARLLNIDRHNATPEQNRKIYNTMKELQQLNGDKPLHPGDPVDIPQKYAQAKSENKNTAAKSNEEQKTEVVKPAGVQIKKQPLHATHVEPKAETSQQITPAHPEQTPTTDTPQPRSNEAPKVETSATQSNRNPAKVSQAETENSSDATVQAPEKQKAAPFSPEWEQQQSAAYVKESSDVGKSIAQKLAANPNDAKERELLGKALDTATTSSVDGVKDAFINSFNKTMSEQHGSMHIDSAGHLDAAAQTKAEAPVRQPEQSAAPKDEVASKVDTLISAHKTSETFDASQNNSFVMGSAAERQSQQNRQNQDNAEDALKANIKDAAKNGTEQDLINRINNEAGREGYHVETKTELGTPYYHLVNSQTGDDITISQTGKSMVDGEARQAQADADSTRHQLEQQEAYKQEQARPKPQNASQMAAEIAADGGKLSENHQNDLSNLIDSQLRQHKDVGQLTSQINESLAHSGSKLKVDLTVQSKNEDYERNPSERYHRLSLDVTDTSTGQSVTQGQRIDVISVPMT